MSDDTEFNWPRAFAYSVVAICIAVVILWPSRSDRRTASVECVKIGGVWKNGMFPYCARQGEQK